ncbi:hypothetical protein [Ferruginibacter sp.]|nr:hypothetical protein [Ferruginibacter sp.]
MRRRIVIVDDIPQLAINLNVAIANYYNDKKIFDYQIIPFTSPTHFCDAKNYINNFCSDIDMIFSDQKLGSGTGIMLFQEASKIFSTGNESITAASDIFKVLHSHEEIRHKQFQNEQRLGIYDFFVNSDEKQDVIEALDFYENNIVKVKEKGNKTFIQFSYDNPTINSLLNNFEITPENTVIKLKDIYFLLMDKEDRKGEHYFIYYDNGNEIVKSKESKKILFHDKMKSAHFVNGKLKDGFQEKFKINPLRIASINQNICSIILLSPYSVKLKINYKSIEAYPNPEVFQNPKDPFFLR